MDYGKVVNEIFEQIKGDSFRVELWDGRVYKYGSSKASSFTLVFNDERSAKRLLSQGALGFGEAYMEGSLRIEGNLESYLRLRHQFKHVKPSLRLVLASLLAVHSMPKRREDQISYHYDLGNDFFEMLLDPKTMSYSAGKYTSTKDDLNDAQLNKFKLISGWLNLPKKSKVLDVGFGWGGFVNYAAKNMESSVVGYTLSKSQLGYAKEIVDKNKLNLRVSLEYLDMLKGLPPASYDAVVIIEAIEHVGKKNLPGYFSQLSDVLKSNGSLYIQMTGQYKQRSADKWTLKYVFPGGYLPTIGELLSAAGEAGFIIEELLDDTPDYIRTMSEWIRNLEMHKVEIVSMFGAPHYRLWELWMHGAKVAFEVNYMNLFRIHLRKKID